MTETEEAILQAAFALAEWEAALEHGCPAQKRKSDAYDALMMACADHAAENDGQLTLSKL